MNIISSPALKEQLNFLAQAHTLHVRTGSATGELFKTDAQTENALLGLSGQSFTLTECEFLAGRGKSRTGTNSVTNEKYTVATGNTEVLCKVSVKHDASNQTYSLRMKLGEVASMDVSSGKGVLFFERVGAKTDKVTGAIIELGQFWAHAERGATIEQQQAFISAAKVVGEVASGTKPPAVKLHKNN